MGQLGDTLRERRVTLGITLEQAAEATRIRGKMLGALEAGDYARLPNPGYVRGYVSSYARFLELDPVPLLAMYRAETGSGRYHDVNVVNDEPVARRGEQHDVPRNAVWMTVAAIALVAVVIWVVVRLNAKPAALTPVPAVTASGTVEGQGAGPGAATAVPSHVKVSVASDSASAVTITLDGKPYYKGSMTGGQSKEFDLTDSAVLVIARPSAVTVTQDGTKVKLASKGPTTITLKTPPAE